MRASIVAISLITAAVSAAETTSMSPILWQEDLPGAGVKAPIEIAGGALLSVASDHTTAGADIVCFRSDDGGSTWTRAGTIAHDPITTTDLGDSALLRLRDGTILCSYRRNHAWHRPLETRSFAVEVAQSSDGGATWHPHSVVAESKGTTAGLWAQFLFQTSSGDIQCYYDDEVTPSREGFDRHQWVTMKTWNSATRAWERPVTAARAKNPAHLSRDGMPGVVEVKPGRLLCVFESVHIDPPHKGVLRSTVSNDGGATWSWRENDRPIVYGPKDITYNALAPWSIRLISGELACAFVTDEDRDKPDVPATAILDEEVKVIYSSDSGATWSRPDLVSDAHPCYLPGIAQITQGKYKGQVIVQHTSKTGLRVRIGRPAAGSKR